MEAAKIEWSSIESVFLIDDAYEYINAPQWVDFLTSSQSHDDDDDGGDDDAWFCRPECKHPKTADDFLKSTPSSKLLSKLIGLTDWNPNRQPSLKRRGVANNNNQVEDSENHNPNHSYCSPPPSHGRQFKATPKALEGDENDDAHFQSAKDLFGGGGDILSKITDLGTKFKKMASLTRPPFSKDSTHQHPPLINKQPTPTSKDLITSANPNQRKPFTIKDTCQSSPLKSSPYRNPTNSTKIHDDAENVPISLNLNQNVLPIRTNPPTPQGFSATRDPTTSTPSKGPKSRLMKREVLEEMEQDRVLRAEVGEKCSQNESLIAGKQGRGLDVLWFLKPCTL